MMRLVFISLLVALSAVCLSECGAAQESRPDPFQGLKSVADAAEKNWNEAHHNFRKLAEASQSPCDGGLKRALSTAQAALKERERAWREFYSQRGQDSQKSAKDDAAFESQREEELRALKVEITASTGQLDELKRRRAALESEGDASLGQEDLAKAKKDLDTLISNRQQSITEDQNALPHLQELIRGTQALERKDGGDATVSESYVELIDAETTLYSSIYRAREIRISLECRPPEVPPPPSPPEP